MGRFMPRDRARFRSAVVGLYQQAYPHVDEDDVMTVERIEARPPGYVLHLAHPKGGTILVKPSHVRRLAPASW